MRSSARRWREDPARDGRRGPLRRSAGAVPLGAALLAAAGALAGEGPQPERLRCEYAENPLGIDSPRPRLSWQVVSPRRGEAQTAYQVQVASSEALLRAGAPDLWDSQKVASDRSIHVEYAGRPLAPRMRCSWRVRLWDSQGRAGEFSAPAYWEMGLLDPSDWKAKWIGAELASAGGPGLQGSSWIWSPEGEPARDAPRGERFFRREFELPIGAKPARARIVVSVDDQFVLYVNGKEAARSDGQQDAWRRPVSVDLKPRLVPGRNVLALRGTNAGGPAGFVGRLLVELEGGRTVDVPTDRRWRVLASMREGWEAPGFRDQDWPEAKEVARFGEGPWGAPGAAGGGPCPHLRREFVLKAAPARARLYASALGLYEVRLNGRRVGDHVFAPGWTDYNRRVQYQTYDVTGLLRAGRNAIGAILGEGWYAGHVGLGGPRRYGSLPLFICQLEVAYADGTSETVTSDSTWKAAAGPVLSSDLLMGETYDAREELAGWDAEGFRDSHWLPVVVREPRVRLEAQRGVPVRRLMEIKPVRLAESARGAFVFDLGQNMVGWARLQVREDPGTELTLRFAEMLNPDGTIYTRNLRGARCTDRYVCKGGALETWEPRFTFRGFRYVELTGCKRRPELSSITGVVVGSDTPPTGTFECSNDLLNRLQSNIVWGQRGNFLSVPTDCPQRDERLGWTGDAQVFVRTAAFNADVAGFFTKWLVDLDDSQGPEGDFPDVAPRVAAGSGTAAWGDAGVICPWAIYVAYGDLRILEEHFPAMTKWVEYCRRHSTNLIRPASGYGDWLSVGADTPKDLLATAYFAHSTDLVARSARVLGRSSEAEKYERLLGEIKDAFRARFIRPDGRVHGETQTGYLLALGFDLLPEGMREAALNHLVEDIRKRDWHLSTGFVGVGHLLPVLTRFGRTDVAWRLMLQETYPSWLFPVKHGATTIWERWDGWTPERGFQDPGMNSFNHYAFGSCGEWMYTTVAGIAPDPERPGYKRIVVRPRPGGGLAWARGELASMHGRVACSWKIHDGRLTMDVTVPGNATATVYVPATGEGSVSEGGRPASRSPGLEFLRMEDGCAVFEAGSGSYSFTAPAPAQR